MPLSHLIDTFNHRFTTENQLLSPPFDFQGGQVFGRFGSLTFTSDFRPVRLLHDLNIIRGHETLPNVFSPANPDPEISGNDPEDIPNIVSLDRLARTVHMLNYLLLEAPEGNLFLHVHPQHILNVSKDHGAYFEDIIRACGLPVQRVVISLTLGEPQTQNLKILIDRLKNYRERGYGIAIRFGRASSETLVAQFREHFLHRLAPDHVRFSKRFFEVAYQERYGERERQRLFTALRQHDTQLHITGITTEKGLDLAHGLGVDFVEGRHLEKTIPIAPILSRSA
jgi:EAL domain-containing protein (putative c-di-GMP-specific phosphodiesterase class I)